MVLRAVIPAAVSRPVLCRESDGRWQAYYRVADENIVAHPLMVRAWKRRAAQTDGGLLTLTPDESALLRCVSASEDGVTPEELSRAVCLSLRTTENLIVRLAAMNLIGFRHHSPGFVIIPL